MSLCAGTEQGGCNSDDDGYDTEEDNRERKRSKPCGPPERRPANPAVSVSKAADASFSQQAEQYSFVSTLGQSSSVPENIGSKIDRTGSISFGSQSLTFNPVPHAIPDQVEKITSRRLRRAANASPEQLFKDLDTKDRFSDEATQMVVPRQDYWAEDSVGTQSVASATVVRKRLPFLAFAQVFLRRLFYVAILSLYSQSP